MANQKLASMQRELDESQAAMRELQRMSKLARQQEQQEQRQEDTGMGGWTVEQPVPPTNTRWDTYDFAVVRAQRIDQKRLDKLARDRQKREDLARHQPPGAWDALLARAYPHRKQLDEVELRISDEEADAYLLRVLEGLVRTLTPPPEVDNSELLDGLDI